MSWDSAAGALNATCLATFGQAVTYRTTGGASVAIAGIVRTGARLEGVAPGIYAILFVRMSDLPQVPENGDYVEIGSSTYRIFETQADASGGVTMSLRME